MKICFISNLSRIQTNYYKKRMKQKSRKYPAKDPRNIVRLYWY